MVHQEVWEDFKEELAKVWTSYKDFDGTPLNTRFVDYSFFGKNSVKVTFILK